MYFGVSVAVEVLIDEVGDFLLVVDVVSEAVISHIAYEFTLQLQVVQRVLEVIQIHTIYIFIVIW